MTIEAINWAFATKIKPSTAKFILVAMANCAQQDWLAWPTISYLAEATGQDRKTVIENIKRLIGLGYVEDSGGRKGSTNQVIVYRLKNTKNRTFEEIKSTELGTIEEAQTVPSFPNNSSEIGIVKDTKESQKRDSIEDERVPFFPLKSTVFPTKEYRFSAERVPKTGHGTIMEPLKEPLRNIKDSAEKYSALADLTSRGIDSQLANDWIAHRKLKKALPTKTALDGIEKQAVIAGISLREALEMCCQRGWIGLKAEWIKQQEGNTSQHRQSEKRKAFYDEIAGRTGSDEPHTIDIN